MPRKEHQFALDERHLLTQVHIDGILLFILGLVLTSGLMILYSASEQNMHLVIKQGIRAGIGLVLMILMAQLPTTALRRYSPAIFGGLLLTLLLVLLTGDASKGAQRWLDLGFVRFQPSELMKVVLPLWIATLLHRYRAIIPFERFMAASISIIAPVLLISMQPDLGTAILVGSAGGMALFFSGLSWRYIIGISTLGCAMMPLGWHNLQPYQRQRITTFLDLEKDPLGSGYQILQSRIAIGSGGWQGKGWLQGTQSHLDFLPERTTDFIFSVMAEEWGLQGVLALLSAYFAIILRCFYISMKAKDRFDRIIGASLTFTFFSYLFINIAMVTGMLPVVGVPLPLISYGGTSIVTILASFGILMSIQTHKQREPF